MNIEGSLTGNDQLRESVITGLYLRDTQEQDLVPLEKPTGMLGAIVVLEEGDLAAIVYNFI